MASNLVSTPNSTNVVPLADLATAAAETMADARSARTLDAYGRDWGLFVDWCESVGRPSLPADPGTVSLFVQHCADNLGHKPSTISRRLVSINVVHADQGFDRPGSDQRVRDQLKGLRRRHALACADAGTKTVAKAAPILRDDLVRMLPSLSSSDLIDIRDRAVLLVSWAGFMRRSEVESIDVGLIEPIDGGLRFTFPASKTGESVRELFRSGSEMTCPVRAVERWIEAAGITEGRLFRSVTRGGDIGDKLSGRSVDRIIRKRAKAADIDAAVSAHSVRRGPAQQARADGHSLLDIAGAGGWAENSAVVAGYASESESRGLRLL